MPYFKTSTEWYEQSSLLLKARPTTARVTSKYTILKPIASKIRKRQNYASKHSNRTTTSTSDAPASAAQSSLPAPEEPTATFTLKTYDPISGTCLQYQTNKAAEVGRLIGSLGRLGRHMAALPEEIVDLSVPAPGPGEGVASGVATPTVEKDGLRDVVMTDVKGAVAGGGGSGGGKKKKKGKK